MSRTYEQTHPYINFDFPYKEIEPKEWIRLGNIEAKCREVTFSPLSPEFSEYLHSLFLAKGVSGTTKIEGNSLSEEQVAKRIAGKLKIPPSQDYLAREVDNMVQAYNRVMGKFLESDPLPWRIEVEDIKELNRLSMDGLPKDDDFEPGSIRRYMVGVGKHRGAPPEDCEFLLRRLCDWLNGPAFEVHSTEHSIVYGFIRAVIAHLYILWIHPFGDGNGRTARLVEFQILLASGVPTAAAHLLTVHYNKTRDEYYRQLDKSRAENGGVKPFLHYALQGFYDGLGAQLAQIRWFQLRVAWVHHIHERFRGEPSTQASKRRRALALALSLGKTIERDQVRYVSPEIAEMYADKGEKTVSRDLSVLEEMGLIVKDKRCIRLNSEAMFGFYSLVFGLEMRVIGAESEEIETRDALPASETKAYQINSAASFN